MPSLNRVKKQAKSVSCQGQLKQWALIFAMYTNDNDGYFHTRDFGANYQKMWPQFYQSYYSDPMMRCCPAARNPAVHIGPYGTWGSELGMMTDLSCPVIGCQLNDMITYCRSLEWIRESLFVTV